MTTKLIPANAVSSFFFYMWNEWCEDECKIIFNDYRHFWNKWCSLAGNDVFGATEKFFSELSDTNKELLVNRAVAVYDGKAKRTTKSLHQLREDALQGISNSTQALHETIIKIVENHDGLIHTQNQSCDTIYSIEYLSIDDAEIIERTVIGIRVKDNDLQIFTENNSRSCRINVSEDDLMNPEFEDNWVSLKDSCQVIYVQTLLNIAESIEQYI